MNISSNQAEAAFQKIFLGLISSCAEYLENSELSSYVKEDCCNIGDMGILLTRSLACIAGSAKWQPTKENPDWCMSLTHACSILSKMGSDVFEISPPPSIHELMSIAKEANTLIAKENNMTKMVSSLGYLVTQKKTIFSNQFWFEFIMNTISKITIPIALIND